LELTSRDKVVVELIKMTGWYRFWVPVFLGTFFFIYFYAKNQKTVFEQRGSKGVNTEEGG